MRVGETEREGGEGRGGGKDDGREERACERWKGGRKGRGAVWESRREELREKRKEETERERGRDRRCKMVEGRNGRGE